MKDSCIKNFFHDLHSADIPAICFITPEGIQSVCFSIFSYRLGRARYILIESSDSKLTVSAFPSDNDTFISFARHFMFGIEMCAKDVIDWFKWIRTLNEYEKIPLKFTVQVEENPEPVKKAIEDILKDISTIDYEKPRVIYSEDLLGIMETHEPEIYSDWEEYVANNNQTT